MFAETVRKIPEVTDHNYITNSFHVVVREEIDAFKKLAMRHEPVIYAFKDTAKHKFYGDRKQTTVWEYDRPTKSKLHPTMKTLQVVGYPIKMSSQENGIVVDLFGGSGTTLMASEQLNRISYLMELDPKYASAIVRRYTAYKQGTKDIFVIREGKKLRCSDVYVPSREDLEFQEDKVNRQA